MSVLEDGLGIRSIRETAVVVPSNGTSGGLGWGRTPLGSDPSHQLPRMLSRKDLNSVSFSAGMSSAFTWLDLW